MRWPLNKGKHQIQRNVNRMKNEMPFSSIRQENLEREHLLGGKGILPIKMGTVIAVWKRNLTASIKSKNIHSPHLSNPTIGNLISIDVNTTMGLKNKGT